MAEHGGARPGAGRKSKYGADTVTVRVPTWAKDLIPRIIEDINTGHVVRSAEARQLLADHLAGLDRKAHPKRSVIEQALWLLGDGSEGLDLAREALQVTVTRGKA